MPPLSEAKLSLLQLEAKSSARLRDLAELIEPDLLMDKKWFLAAPALAWEGAGAWEGGGLLGDRGWSCTGR